MIKHILIEKIQPCWLRIGNEMDLMAFFGQCFAKFGGYHPTTAKGRVTNDSDFHLKGVKKTYKQNDYSAKKFGVQ